VKRDGSESTGAAVGTLDEIFEPGVLGSVFQPIVDLETGKLFGFEALSRGPSRSPLEWPDRLFSAARAQNRLAELDAACQKAAVVNAQTHGIKSPLTLFVNVEPDAGGFRSLPMIGPDVRGIVELTERTLTSRLAELLPAVQAARERGWGIALDDVGADTRSLALMPLLRPDVIKLDLLRASRTKRRHNMRERSVPRWDRAFCLGIPRRSPSAWRPRTSRYRFTQPRCRTPGARRLSWLARTAPCATERLRCWERSAASLNARRL
jgi:EAL domain-containing protein (putative c-di-GMP-specific phosphodiesterase class I)